MKRTCRQSVPNPTRKEIHERCLEIQAKWDEATRRKRMGLPGEPEAWQPPVIAYEELGIDDNNKRTEE